VSAARCIGEPLSWPRLERFAAGEREASIAAHLDACVACRACLDEIAADAVVLPRLPAAPEASPSRWARWIFGGGAAALAVAAAILLLVSRRGERGAVADATPTARVAVKGAGTVVLSIVRDRDGAIAYDPTTFRTGDRLKVRVTCAPGPSIWADVIVYQPDASYPLPPVELPCGNDAVVPGAFRIDALAPATVCVALAVGAAPARHRPGGPKPGQLACAPLAPEAR
jgi:hypothetical protein